jgi:hypothetical protein
MTDGLKLVDMVLVVVRYPIALVASVDEIGKGLPFGSAL